MAVEVFLQKKSNLYMIREYTSKRRFSYYSTKPYKLGLLFVCKSSISSKPPIDLGGIKIRLNDFDSLAGLIVIL